MKIAIPSHRRRESLEQKTLKMLSENSVKNHQVYIFVSDERDFKNYESLSSKGYNVVYDLDLGDIVKKLNYIHRYFPIGDKVILVEDDIEGLAIKSGKNSLDKFTGLKELSEKMFTNCEVVGTKIWGVSSNANPFYMKNDISDGLIFIVANIFGFISTKDPFLRVSHVCKSDYERTLLYFVKFGRVLRSNFVCAITKNYKNSGGLQEIKSNRARLERLACISLVKRFPHLVQINEKKSEKSMYMELKLRPLKNKKGFTDYAFLQEHYDKEYMKWKSRLKDTQNL